MSNNETKQNNEIDKFFREKVWGWFLDIFKERSNALKYEDDIVCWLFCRCAGELFIKYGAPPYDKIHAKTVRGKRVTGMLIPDLSVELENTKVAIQIKFPNRSYEKMWQEKDGLVEDLKKLQRLISDESLDKGEKYDRGYLFVVVNKDFQKKDGKFYKQSELEAKLKEDSEKKLKELNDKLRKRVTIIHTLLPSGCKIKEPKIIQVN